MGSDDLFHKRKQRNLNSLKRKSNNREPYPVILIVCEGKKTEPNYLKGLREDLQLKRENIKIIDCPRGNDPLTIVDYSLDQFDNKQKNFDRIFCVFDKDEHSNYSIALNKIDSHQNKSKSPIPIYAITSVPCFEYWLLLHYVHSTKPYQKMGNKSAAEHLISEIQNKNYIPDYYKGDKLVFQKTKPNLNNAIIRAKKIKELQSEINSDNPSTNFYELVEYLQSLKIGN